MLGLGDTAGVRAPIRHVTAVAYDGDKMVMIFPDEGGWEWVKSCYLYRNAGRLQEGAVPVTRRKFERMVNQMPTKLLYENEKNHDSETERPYTEHVQRRGDIGASVSMDTTTEMDFRLTDLQTLLSQK